MDGKGTDGSPEGVGESDSSAVVRLVARPEKRLIRRGGSRRHVDFLVSVSEAGPRAGRTPVRLALVVDRSGSMEGEKLDTARRAALAALERLDERDVAAVVVYDNHIDVVQPAAPVTPELKARLRTDLAKVQARGTTALHEGWLSGCHAIAAGEGEDGRGVARCFLLTDGLANVGLTDPEQIAAQAAGVRENARVATSTFGIGPDYAEGLLGPLAVAGGGQFHHLRTAADIAATFLGELADLGAVVARGVRVEVEPAEGARAEVISPYWASAAEGRRWTIAVGDLLGGEERHVVARFAFPGEGQLPWATLRARVVWQGEDGRRDGDWQEVGFTYANERDCDAERRDPAVMHWVGLHHADRAQREATQASRRGDLHAARQTLRGVREHIATYVGGDPDLRAAMLDLDRLEGEVARHSVDSLTAKEAYFQAQRRSRGQKDLRSFPPLAGDPDGSNPADRAKAAEVVRGYLLRSVSWPSPVPPRPSLEGMRDRFRGCLLWGAVGDALGRAVESQDPARIRAQFGPEGLRDYTPGRHWRGGPKGMLSDDTQLTIEVARTLLVSQERFDAEDFARRLVAWLPQGRGVGRATREAVEELMGGKPWWLAGLGVNSAGNGAAMRAAPVGLVHALARTAWPLRRDAVLSAFPTHTHPVGIGGAVVVAAAVAYGLREWLRGAQALDPRALLNFATDCIEGAEPEPTQERKPGGRAVRLGERVREVAGLLGAPTDEAFAYLWNGAFALESVPAALYCALRSPDDPRAVILTAVNAGHDADSVASMAGNIVGAWCGAGRLQAEAPGWWEELEDRDELIALADRLAELALRRAGEDGSGG